MVAACCVYYNPHISFQDSRTLLIGHFSCIEDVEVFESLMSACYHYAQDAGCKYLLGPINGSTWEDYRFAVEGTAPRFFTEPEQSKYYPRLWAEAGFEQVAGYYSSEALLSNIPDQWAAYEAALSGAGITVSDATGIDWRQTVEALYPLCSTAFSHAPFYSPVSADHFIEKYTAIQKVWRPELILIARNAAGQPLAFILALPNHLDGSGESCILKTIARLPDADVDGLIPYMGYRLYAVAKSLGYTRIIHAFMHEDNRSLLRSGQAGGAIIRRYALFAKKVIA